MNLLISIISAIALFASSALAAELTGTLKTIADSGKIKVGFRVDAPPMSFIDSSGAAVGYSIDLCKGVADEVATTIGRTVTMEFLPITASNRFTAVADGTVDILCESTTKTLSRAETVDFTSLIFLTGASLLSRSDIQISRLAQLEGRKVAAIRDTTTIAALKQALDAAFVRAEIVPVGSAVEGLESLFVRGSDVAAFASDQIVLIGLVLGLRDGVNLLHLSPELLSKETLALAVRRNDSAFRLTADRALSQLYRSGRIAVIYDKWFAALPPTPLLQALYELNAMPD